MRYVVVPNPKPIYGFDGRTPMNVQEPDGSVAPLIMTMKRFFDMFLVDDPRCSANLRALRMVNDILAKVRLDHPVLHLSESEWQFIRPIVEEPQGGYRGGAQLARQCVNFAAAILDAGEKNPCEEPSDTPVA